MGSLEELGGEGLSRSMAVVSARREEFVHATMSISPSNDIPNVPIGMLIMKD
jgi:hypothetical protein